MPATRKIMGVGRTTIKQIAGSETFAGLDDVNVSGIAQGAVLYYNGSEFVNLNAGTSGQVLTTNGGSANPTWTNKTSATGIVGGTDRMVQFNDGGSDFGGVEFFEFRKNTNNLMVSGSAGYSFTARASGSSQTTSGIDVYNYDNDQVLQVGHNNATTESYIWATQTSNNLKFGTNNTKRVEILASNGKVFTSNDLHVSGTLTAGTATLIGTDTLWNAKGDLAVGTGSDTAIRVAIGSDGKVLTADSSTTSGVDWVTPAAAASTNDLSIPVGSSSGGGLATKFVSSPFIIDPVGGPYASGNVVMTSDGSNISSAGLGGLALITETGSTSFASVASGAAATVARLGSITNHTSTVEFLHNGKTDILSKIVMTSGTTTIGAESPHKFILTGGLGITAQSSKPTDSTTKPAVWVSGTSNLLYLSDVGMVTANSSVLSAGYVPYVSGAAKNGIGNSVIYNDASNNRVGINTASPNRAFDVRGTSLLSGNTKVVGTGEITSTLDVGSNITGTGTATFKTASLTNIVLDPSNRAAFIKLQDSSRTATTASRNPEILLNQVLTDSGSDKADFPTIRFTKAGPVAADMSYTNLGYRIYVSGETGAGSVNGPQAMIWDFNSDVSDPTNYTEKLALTTTGGLRINNAYTLPTAAPAGNGYVITGATDGTTAWVANSGGGGGATFWSEGSSNIIYYNSGNVGVGTDNPTHKLTVSGTTTDNKLFSVISGSTTAFTVSGTHVGIGVETPLATRALHVVGRSFFNGDVITEDYLQIDKDSSPGLLVGEGGDVDLYYDGTNAILNPRRIGTGYLQVKGDLLVGSGTSSVLDKIHIGDTTKGVYGYNNRLDFYVASNPRAHIDSSTFYSATSGGPSLDLTPGPAGTANYGFVGDTNTGMTRSAADTLHLLTAGVSGMTMNSTQGVGLLTESIDTRQGQGLVISGTNITDTWSDTDTKRKPTSLFLPSLTSGAYVLAGIGGKTSLMASQRAEPPYMIIGAAEQTILHNNAMNSGRAVSLVLAGTAGYNSGGTDYGNFGSLIFHGNSNWSGNARRWLLSNAFRNSGAGDMGLGFAGGDSSAALDPTVSGSTPSVVMSTDSNYGVAGKGGLLVGNTTHINSGKVTIRDADNNKQLTLAHDGSNYTTFKTDSSGILTIATNMAGAGVTDRFKFDGGHFRGTDTNAPSMRNETPSSTNPVFTFNNDVDTGMSRAAADELSLITAATERVRIKSDGKVGIGTPEPPEKLYVSGGRIGSFETNREILVDPYVAVGGDNQYSGILGQEGLMLATPGDSYLDLWVPDGRYVSFRSATGSTSDNATTYISGTRANSEYIYFKPTGTAYDKSAYVYARKELQLAAGSNMSFNAAGSLTIHIDDDMNIFNPGGNSNLTIRQDSTAYYELQADDDFVWKTANTNTKMILTSGGRLGINTTAPGSQLHVSGNNDYNNTGGIRLGNNTTYASIYTMNDSGGLEIDSPHSMILDSGRHMEFHVGGTTREHRYMYATTQYGFMTTVDSNTYWAIGNKSAASAGLLLSGAAGGIRMVPSDGNVTVVGTISATAKSFDIPHPDKEGMRLVHGSLEGPEHGVYARGTAKGHGETTIELPDYWKTLVGDDYTLQLTSYNSSNVYIVDKKEDSFTVDSNALTYKFDYVVIGRREEIEVEQDGN